QCAGVCCRRRRTGRTGQYLDALAGLADRIDPAVGSVYQRERQRLEAKRHGGTRARSRNELGATPRVGLQLVVKGAVRVAEVKLLGQATQGFGMPEKQV